ncbi:MAG: hypothetical protein GX877_03895 [Bacteroidales bacterium]|nr:hypothetical protein [Bacteroidales bacterium]
MKTIYFLSALCLSLLFLYPVKAQVVVTGHVSAEIVDVASVSSQDSFSQLLDKSPDFASTMDLDSFVLGEITIQAGSRVAYQVVLTHATVAGAKNEQLTLETSFVSCGKTTDRAYEAFHKDGDQTLQLASNLNPLYEQGSGSYQGSCNFVLVYD